MIPWLDEIDNLMTFPHPDTALTEPDGLLAAGGNLSPTRLIYAYRSGIFPWFSEGEPILWWTPSQRAIIFPEQIHISHSLSKTLRKTHFEFTHNAAFKEVMLGCSYPRKNQEGTWINNRMIDAYCELHRLGFARSIECYLDKQLVGGIYGVQLGKVFFGESMFHTASNASKASLIEIAKQPNVSLIDCQIPNSHLESMGMVMIPRDEFMGLLDEFCEK